MILGPFLKQLTNEERQCGHLQQDGATTHTANNSMKTLLEVFDERIVSTGFWPPRSADISVCDF
jgi:hypothetical protein